MTAKCLLIFISLIPLILVQANPQGISASSDSDEDFADFLRKLLFPGKEFCDTVYIGEKYLDTLHKDHQM